MKIKEGNPGTKVSDQVSSSLIMSSKAVTPSSAAAASASSSPSPSNSPTSSLSTPASSSSSLAAASSASKLKNTSSSTEKGQAANGTSSNGCSSSSNNNSNNICSVSNGAGATSPPTKSLTLSTSTSNKKLPANLRNNNCSNNDIYNGSMRNTTTTTNTTTSAALTKNGNGIAEPAIIFAAGPDADDDILEFSEAQHPCSVLSAINKLRQQRQFCDISLLVENQEFAAHRAVLAACSPYLFDFLSCLEETTEQHPIYKLGREVPVAGFRLLLDFMYTGRLKVPLEEVPTVYATARELKMESATRACAEFLSTHLTAANCLGIRRLTKDKSFKETVDDYICSNLEAIINSKAFYGLTELQVEVVGLDEELSDEAMERRMFSLVLDWAKNNLNDLKPKMDRLVEQVNVLYLDSDNTLRDCAQVEDLVISSDDEVVQDYKIMARRRSHGTKKDGSKHAMPLKTHGAQPFHKFSLNPEEALSVAERECRQRLSGNILYLSLAGKAYLAIAVLDGHLMAISVHVRPPVANNMASNGGSDLATHGHTPNGHSRHGSFTNLSGKPDSPTGGPATAAANTSPGGAGVGGTNRLSPTLVPRKASIIPLANMSTARCAMGAVELDGKLIVSGGYDRGECLQGVEAFSIQNNAWTSMPSMNRARGRFSMAVLDGSIYVCGGSDGWHELACVERFDPQKQTWSYVASMIKQRSSHGVATLNGKLYCVGGCEGQRSMAECEVYDPTTNKWSFIAPLNTARSQACVVVVNGNLLAIGGTDMWNTLNSVEVYNPEANEWLISSCLNIARRGAGVDVVEGQVVVVGGSDGSHSIVSSEILDTASNVWTMGPPLITPRANLSVVAMGGRLYALGGFSGKKFLSTLEWLDMEDMEWFGHTPRDIGPQPGSHDGSPREVSQ
ncbi:influenza virus NS1A-binding protein homolog A-like [Elysia marginata]|uniref:Influenza virus NS1A-binding protein homolog A-like n=1 Tax=Elysia marginata TaxID=1093978 RepID=A0AAV4GK77_9GAST|nr:influenza virus NS1A-binding protein homolog A-like [Elysia marginata]